MRLSTKNRATFAAAALAAAAWGAPASAAVIAEWTFETSQPTLSNSTVITDIAPEVGAGTASGVHASSATDYASTAGNGSSRSFSANTWAVGDYYQFQVDLSLAESVTVSWDQTRSATAPTTFDFSYSTDGSSFTTFLDNYTVLESISATGRTAWSINPPRQSAYTFAVDLTDVTAIEGDSTVYFRLVADSAPTSGAGTIRVDNFNVEAVVPEPTGLAALGVVGTALALRRRRRA